MGDIGAILTSKPSHKISWPDYPKWDYLGWAHRRASNEIKYSLLHYKKLETSDVY
jgi:hypothetical protein